MVLRIRYGEERTKKNAPECVERWNHNDVQKEIGSSVQSAVAMHAGPVTMCRSSVMMRRGFCCVAYSASTV